MPRLRISYDLLDQLAVGESILYPLNCASSLSSILTLRAKRDGKKFARRTLPEGIRVWRVG